MAGATPARIEMSEKAQRSWNVLSIYGTALPPNVLLMAKLVVAALLLTRPLRTSEHHLPFFSIFDHLGSPQQFRLVLSAIFVSASILLLMNVAVRTMCVIAGSAMVISLLASKPFFANNLLFAGLLLILAGIYDERSRCWMLRLQVAVMYLGAGVNKLLEPDWRSGQFFQHWYGVFHQSGWYVQLSEQMPPLLLAKLMTWPVILLELLLAVALLYRKTVPIAITAAIGYHTALLLMTNSTFTVFYYAVAASMLAFVDWPERPMRVVTKTAIASRFSRFRRILDPDSVFEFQQDTRAPAAFTLARRNTVESGWTAVLRTLLLYPGTYFAFLMAMKLPDSVFHQRRWVALGAFLFFLPLAIKVSAKTLGLGSFVAPRTQITPGKEPSTVL